MDPKQACQESNKSCSLYSVSLALAVWPSILFAFNRGVSTKGAESQRSEKGGAHAPHPSEIVLDDLTEPKTRNKLRTLGRARERKKDTSSQESRSSSCEHQRFENKASDQTLMHEPNDPPKTQKNAHCKQMRINECVRDLRHFKCHMKATIVTTLSFHQAKHLPCSVNDDNKNISPCIIWTSYTLRVEPSPCRAYRRGGAL